MLANDHARTRKVYFKCCCSLKQRYTESQSWSQNKSLCNIRQSFDFNEWRKDDWSKIYIRKTIKHCVMIIEAKTRIDNSNEIIINQWFCFFSQACQVFFFSRSLLSFIDIIFSACSNTNLHFFFLSQHITLKQQIYSSNLIREENFSNYEFKWT